MVITLRSDFEGAISHPPFLNALQRVDLSPYINSDELRSIVEEPAGRMMEEKLTNRIVEDAEKSFCLSRLGFLLRLLWEEKAGNRLEIATYEKVGGVRKALQSIPV